MTTGVNEKINELRHEMTKENIDSSNGLGNVNAYINHEVVPPFLKSDTVISTSDYHSRLD